MNVETIVRGLKDSLEDVFKCSEAPRGAVRVRTPLTYPDGTLIDLFLVARDDGTVVVTDHGETMNCLRMRSAKGITRGQSEKIARICESMNVLRVQGTVLVIAKDRWALGESVARVAQAAVLISHVDFN